MGGATFDPMKVVKSALKAGGYTALGVLLFDGSLVPGLLETVSDPGLRGLLALFAPALLAALQNWYKHQGR